MSKCQSDSVFVLGKADLTSYNRIVRVVFESAAEAAFDYFAHDKLR